MDSINDRGNSFFRFEDLRVYHKALDYFIFVSQTMGRLNSCDQAYFGSPFLHSTRCFLNDIAEGSSNNKNHFITQLKDAKARIRECVTHSNILYKAGFLTDEEFETSRQMLMELTKMIGALITSLMRNTRETPEGSDNSDAELGNNVEIFD